MPGTHDATASGAGLRETQPMGAADGLPGCPGLLATQEWDAEPQHLWAGEGGKDSGDHHLLPLGRGACAQDLCQGEEAACPSRNVGGCGGSDTGIPEGAGTLSECVRSSSGSSMSCGEGCLGVCASAGPKAQRGFLHTHCLPNRPQLPGGQAHPSPDTASHFP